MRKKKYDLIFSMGEACACTVALRGSRLQFYSYPLDWVGGSDIKTRANLLVNDFKDMIKKDELFYLKTDEDGKLIYKNKSNRLVFPHDFYSNTPFDIQYKEVTKKYNRRIVRLINQIRNSNRILAVYIQLPNNSKELSDRELIDVQNILQENFSDTKVDLLYLFNDDEISVKNRRIFEINDSITKYVFNYNGRDSKMQANNKKLKYCFNETISISNKFLTFKNKFCIFLHKTKIFIRKYLLNNVNNLEYNR